MKEKKLIKDIMTSEDLKVVKLNASFKKIQSLFEENDFHHIPVVDKMSIIKGIISKSDLAKITYRLTKSTTGKIYSEKTYQNLTAKDIMTPHPIFVNPDDEVSLAADLFLENQYHALPVVEDGELVGIITSHDLLVHAYDQRPVGR